MYEINWNFLGGREGGARQILNPLGGRGVWICSGTAH